MESGPPLGRMHCPWSFPRVSPWFPGSSCVTQHAVLCPAHLSQDVSSEGLVSEPSSQRQRLWEIMSHAFPAICLSTAFVVLVSLLFQRLSVFLSCSCVFCI